MCRSKAAKAVLSWLLRKTATGRLQMDAAWSEAEVTDSPLRSIIPWAETHLLLFICPQGLLKACGPLIDPLLDVDLR